MPRTIATYIVAERRNFSVTRYAERNGGVPEVRHYLWPDGFPRMVTEKFRRSATMYVAMVLGIYTTALRR